MKANNAAKACFEDWLLSFGGISNHEDRAILAQVRAFFEAHGSSRFEALEQYGDKVEKVINRVGFWQYGDKGKEYIILPEQFKNEICKGFDPKQVIQVLSDADILIKDKEGKNTVSLRTPESPNLKRMYVINADMLFSEGTGCTTCTDTDFKEVFSCTPLQDVGVQTEFDNSTHDTPVDTCTPLYTSESETCTDKKDNKIKDCTPRTPCTPKKHDILKNSQNLGFSFDESVIGEV